ncbi:cytochrome P450 [Ktedonosporobacter rubrisoli]|uniref:cytochrome P450 n=1 Tax=Ktedonosporobacter rubrisoli TaxID=2509675 RepID=UPI0013EE848D|nr:cytochrome P450 [Ktedonosporobacter rubrisoli]
MNATEASYPLASAWNSFYRREPDGNRHRTENYKAASIHFRSGHETTAVALTWTWYLLTQHREIYQQLQREVDSVLEGRVPTYQDMARLPYCLQVFKEAMRLYPPVPVFSRAALHDIVINNYLLRQGQAVFLAPYTLHRRTDSFLDPERFDPERFSEANEQRLPRGAYLPFGEDSRICIGKHFALLEGPLLLATLAQRVTFELVPGQHIVPDLRKTAALRPSHGIKVIVRRR